MHKQYFEAARSGGGADVYFLRGNHDNNHIANSNILNKDYHISDKDFYNQATRNANNVVKEYPYNYFYRDFDEYKIRVVFLDSGDIYNADGTMNTSGLNVMYQQRQIDWFKNKALNFSDKADKGEWSLVTLSHSSIETAYMQNILNAFLNGTSYSGSANISYAEVPFSVDLSCDFTDQGAIEYIGHVSGHLHGDNIKNITGISPARPAVEIRNATAPNVTIETITMNDIAMDFIAINKANRTISAYRFGVGEDRSTTY